MTFHITSVGWNGSLIERILDEVGKRTNIRFSHIIVADRDLNSLTSHASRSDVYRIAESGETRLPKGDPALLASLERPDVPTIHSMIMGDRVLKHFAYVEELGYA